MTKFKKSPAHSKQVDEFLRGGSVKASGNLTTLSIRIQHHYLERLRALSYADRNISQRQIIETALDKYFQDNQEQLKNAVDIYSKISR